jgi:short-subunit dehydrogenase
MKKKTALITGASSGIGLEFAKIMAQDGVNLVLVARSETKLAELAAYIRNSYGIQVDILVKDLSRPEAPAEVFQYTKSKGLEVDYLVNNAGFGDFGFFWETDWDKSVQMIQLNMTALTSLCHLYLPEMVKRKSGRILNVASTAAFQPGPTMAVYYATKAYVLHFSEAIANELEGTGVTVTTLCPGPTESNFQQAAAMEESKMVKGKKMPSANEVANFGYQSMLKGQVVAIHGVKNYLMANSVRFSPRSWVVKLVRSMQDK